MAANSNEAMREALKPWISFAEWLIENAGKDALGKVIAENVLTIRQRRDEACAALAEPPRQCDVGTAEEQELRFEEHCNNYNEYCDGCPVPQIWHRGDMVGKCRLAWAQMPYEAANESEAK